MNYQETRVEVSIITALYNKLELTKAFWESLLLYPPSVSWEIVWVDDGSTDGTREWLETLTVDRCVVILNEKNSGYSASNNRGAKGANGSTLIFLNNDVVLEPNWFLSMFELLNKSKLIGVVGNVHMNPKTRKVDHAGVYFDPVGKAWHMYKGARPDSLSGIFKVRASTAACWMIKKAVFLKQGGFDERYINGYEDYDFCLRLNQNGFECWIDLESKIYHHGKSSPGRMRHEDINLARFLNIWGDVVSSWGYQDWPLEYLKRCIRQPRNLNIIKFLDALGRLLHLRSGKSDWSTIEQKKIISRLG